MDMGFNHKLFYLLKNKTEWLISLSVVYYFLTTMGCVYLQEISSF